MEPNLEQDLDRMFAAAREHEPQVDPSPEFMALLWRKIEENRPQSWLNLIKQWSPRLAAVAAAAAITLTLAMNFTDSAMSDEMLESTYVDVLTADSMDEHDQALWTLAGNR